MGPDLSRIGRQRRAGDLLASLLDPKTEVQADNRFYRVVTNTGEEVTGRLLNHDTYTVQLLDLDERLRSFDKAELREQSFEDSPMPSYRGKLSEQEVADLVSYLASRRAPDASRDGYWRTPIVRSSAGSGGNGCAPSGCALRLKKNARMLAYAAGVRPPGFAGGMASDIC